MSTPRVIIFNAEAFSDCSCLHSAAWFCASIVLQICCFFTLELEITLFNQLIHIKYNIDT
jgi:hypothetical protein